MFHRMLPLLAVLSVPLGLPTLAAAQSFGIGPRFSFVRGDLPTNAPSTRFLGGTIRMRSSRHVALEASLDYRTEPSQDGFTRLRETPIQGSLLLFPVRSAFSPYLLGGIGIYSRMTDTLDGVGNVTATTTERTRGWHLGIGAELFFSRHAAFFADYRFRFVKFGPPGEGDDPIHIPGSSLIPALDNVQISHRGSMWTSGMAFYF